MQPLDDGESARRENVSENCEIQININTDDSSSSYSDEEDDSDEEESKAKAGEGAPPEESATMPMTTRCKKILPLSVGTNHKRQTIIHQTTCKFPNPSSCQ